LDLAASVLEEAYSALARFDPDEATVNDWLNLRATLGRAMVRFDEASNQLLEVFGLGSAQQRLLAYLRLRLGEVVEKDELSGVAGIHEWARRVRELRVEHGWPIRTNSIDETLRPGQYILDADEPDESLAQRWRTAHEIRQQPGGARDRLIAYLKAVHPDPADKEQLAYVAKVQAFPRRIRELTEAGWRISSNVDDGQLRSGEYRLESLEQTPPRMREAIKLRTTILNRDEWTCQYCGRTPGDDRVRLQVHHLHQVADGGDNSPDNLVTLCSECHAGFHSLDEGMTDDELLNPSADPHG
jgi:5-methylcytosine-specific restriction endonuclease McrA